MNKIAILDDDEKWCLALKRFFRAEFEVSTFTRISSFLRDPASYELVIVDFSIPPANYERDINGCELISHLKKTLPSPPLCILATGFVSQSDLDLGQKLCPEADGFITKDAGLEAILWQIKNLLAAKVSRK